MKEIDNPKEYYTEYGSKVFDRMIRSVESLTGLQGTLYFPEKEKDRNSFLLKRMGHKNPYCEAMKKVDFAACINCCNTRRDARAKELFSPFLDECVFGVIELVIPVVKNDKLISTISFGQIAKYSDKTATMNYLKAKTDECLCNFNLSEIDSYSNHFLYYPSGRLLQQSELFSFAFIHAAEVMDNIVTEETFKIRSNSIINQVINILNNCDTDFPSQKELSDIIGINPEYLSRLFKKVLGKGYIQYINELRVSRAQHLLKNTYLSITDISNELGISRHSYFSRLFKKMTGLQPARYREIHRLKLFDNERKNVFL